MLTKVLDMEEAKSFDKFTNEKFGKLRGTQETIDVTGECKFHTDHELFDSGR